MGVMGSEPQHKIDELVNEIVGRRDEAIQEMKPELHKLVIGLVDQFVAMKKFDSRINLRSVKFDRMRWVDDDGRGLLVFDITHAGRPLRPRDVRFW